MSDELEPTQYVDVHYDPDTDRMTSDADDYWSELAIDDDRGTVPFLALPFAYFFRPSKFTRSFGVHAPGWLMFFIIWIVGASQIVESFEKKVVLGSSRPWFPESWFEIALIAVLAGIIRGGFVFWLGGYWYRLRLAMCGVHDASWSMTGRVYMIAGIAKHLVFFLIVICGATLHTTFLNYIQDQSTVFALTSAGVLIVLEIWSSCTLYYATKSVFDVKVIWAIVWFLVLPIFLRLIGIAVLVGLMFMSFAAEPSLNQPSKHVNESFQFEYPSNWYITRDEEVPGPVMWFQAEPLFGDAFFEFSLKNVDPEEDMVEDTLQSYIQNAGMEIIGSPRPLDGQGPFEGYGFEYDVVLENTDFTLRLLEVVIEDDKHMLINMLVDSESWDTLKPGYNKIINTLKITPDNKIPPSIASPYTFENEFVAFDLPSNWWLDWYQNEDIENEDGSTTRGMISILVQTPGWGYFRVIIFDSTKPLQDELQVTINEFTPDPELIDQQSMDKWLGLVGGGVDGKVSYNDDTLGSVRLFLAKLADGRFIEIRKSVPDEVADFQAPGFELIESTFKLLVEPEQFESEVDP